MVINRSIMPHLSSIVSPTTGLGGSKTAAVVSTPLTLSPNGDVAGVMVTHGHAVTGDPLIGNYSRSTMTKTSGKVSGAVQ